MILNPSDSIRIDVWVDTIGQPLQGSLTIYSELGEWRTAIVLPAEPFQSLTEFARYLADEMTRHLENLPVQLPLFDVNIITSDLRTPDLTSVKALDPQES